MARPKTRLNRTRGFPLCYFSFFQDFNLWKPRRAVRLPNTRYNNQGGRRLRNSQVDYRFHIIPQLALGWDIVLLFCSLHYLYHSALMHLFE